MRIKRRGVRRYDRIRATHMDMSWAIAETLSNAQLDAVTLAIGSLDHAIGAVASTVGEVDAEQAHWRARPQRTKHVLS